MITFYDIKLMASDSLPKQVEKLSEGKFYLNNGEKWEKQRKELNYEYYMGKINITLYEKRAITLIENVLNNLLENYNFENIPF